MPLTPEQKAQIERAAEMLEGYAAHLDKLSPFNPEEHPYIPSIEEAAEEMRALLAQLEAQEAPADPILDRNVAQREQRLGKYVMDFARKAGWTDDGEGAFEFIQRHSYVVGYEDAGGKVAYGGTETNGSRWPISALVVAEQTRSASAATENKTSSAPRPSMSMFATMADYKAALAKHEAAESALQEMADQAQELGMGYGEAPRGRRKILMPSGMIDVTPEPAASPLRKMAPDPLACVALALSGALPAQQAGEILSAAFGPKTVASPPGSTGSGESINTVESLSAAEGSMEDFADAADLVDAMTAAEEKGDALGLVLAYRHKVRAAALSQPVQAVPDSIRSAGSKMSNVMFNLSQANDSRNAKLYGELYREWDAAIRSVRPSPAETPQ